MVRSKKRYMAVEIIAKNKPNKLWFTEYTIVSCILSAVQKFYGDFGCGVIERGFCVKYCNTRTNVAIIRCSHHSYQFVKSVLPLITQINNIEIKFNTIYIGATIIQCKKSIIRQHRKLLNNVIKHNRPR